MCEILLRMLLDALTNGGYEQVAAIGRDDDTAFGCSQQHAPVALLPYIRYFPRSRFQNVP